MTAEKNAQVKEAVALLKMIRAKKFVATQGSGYHTGDNTPLDQAVVEQLPHGEFHPDFILRPEHDDATWKGCKFRAHVSHDVPTTKSIWMYATTAIARQMVLLKLNDALRSSGRLVRSACARRNTKTRRRNNMPELCCTHCDCCIAAWDGDHCRQCGADCYECPLRLEMIDIQRARDQGLSFWLRLLLAIAAVSVLYILVYWLTHGGL